LSGINYLLKVNKPKLSQSAKEVKISIQFLFFKSLPSLILFALIPAAYVEEGGGKSYSLKPLVKSMKDTGTLLECSFLNF
jgi:hypothetical protein